MSSAWYYRQKRLHGETFLEERAAAKAARRAKTNNGGLKDQLCWRARWRAEKKGMEATITPKDLEWPTHCPVLGMELDYTHADGKKNNRPSLDRWDNSKGYVPGNVFVISWRANMLKSNATADELEKISVYCRHCIW